MARQRLDQLLSSLGYCSRREVRDWLRADCILYEGEPVRDAGLKVEPSKVLIDGEPPDHPEGLLLLLNKPTGLVCSHDAREGPSIYDLFPARWRQRKPVLTSVGRLDKETSGLLLVTDQSELVHRLTSPKHKVPKLYQAKLDQDLDAARQAELVASFAAGGLLLEGEKAACAPAQLRFTGPREAELILIEGKYHQVRRMFAAFDLTVIALHRSSFGELTLDDLKPGEFRELELGSL